MWNPAVGADIIFLFSITWQDAWWLGAVGVVYVALSVAAYSAYHRRIRKRLKLMVAERTTELRGKNQELNSILYELHEKSEIISRLNGEMNDTNRELNITLEEVRASKMAVDLANLRMLESIQYAQRIQMAVLPTPEMLFQRLPNHFLHYQPRDIVSGDFFWAFARRKRLIFAVVDCTGHGVPGALIAILAAVTLNLVLRDFSDIKPHLLLAELNDRIMAQLRQAYLRRIQKEEPPLDSLDMGICSFDVGNRVLSFAGANRPLYHLRGDRFTLFKGDKYSIGGVHADRHFTEKVIEIEPQDRLYLFTDGLTDQLGGDRGRKFTPARLQKFLVENHHLTMKEQGVAFDQHFRQWMGGHRQLDDVTMLGVEMP